MLSMSDRKHVWAVVLAGGEGTRLRSLTESLAGDARPKQFCTLFGGKTLLGHTRERIAPIFHHEQTLFVLSRSHEHYFRRELYGTLPQNSIVQPLNRGTATAIALCLNEINRRDEDARVAFFPSDHHYSDAVAFRSSVTSALALCEDYPHNVMLVGAKPAYPETEYGWIEPGRTLVDLPASPLCRVSRFWEKPSLRQATALSERGCLWNTFVMVGLATAYIELLRQTVPNLSRSVESGFHGDQLDLLYNSVAPVDFSSQVLSRRPQRLLVVCDTASGWTDLGNPRRLIEALAKDGIRPSWLDEHLLAAAGQGKLQFVARSRNHRKFLQTAMGRSV